MADSFTEVTTQGWGSRLGSSIKGVLFGLVLFLAAFVVLFWNEGRAVKRAKDLAEGKAACVAASADQVDPALEGKLVHMTAEATTEEILEDSVFGVRAQALKLRRVVEMYQWQEEVESKTEKKVGGKTETTKTYNYQQGWSSRLIDSSQFKIQEGHQNPGVMPHEPESWVASRVTFGAHVLSPGQVSSINAWSEVPATEDLAQTASGETPGKYKLSGTLLYMGANPATPAIGDLRISFECVLSTIVSIISQQKGESFQPWPTSTGGLLEELRVGTYSMEQIIEAEESENTMMTWLLRLGGFLLMLIGLSMVGKPLSVLGDVVPVIGNLIGAGVVLFAGLLSLGLTLITIAIAWLFYRPLIGIPLLVVGIACIVLLARKKKPAAPAAEPAPAA